MNKLIIATHNMGKYAEIEDFFKTTTHGIELTHLKALKLGSPEETGLTFVENALIKARAATHSANLPAIADDSGLVVETLQGKPGVRSARFASDGSNDEENTDKLIKLIKQNGHAIHPAHYHCSLVLLRHTEDPDPIITQARWHGQIILEKKGKGGFGYDPVFYDPSLECTAAQLSSKEKNNISHRGRALKDMFQQLEKLSWFRGDPVQASLIK